MAQLCWCIRHRCEAQTQCDCSELLVLGSLSQAGPRLQQEPFATFQDCEGWGFCPMSPDALKQNTWYAEYRGGSALPSPEPEDRARCSVPTRGCLRR